jgi:flagellar protein FliO/FliZ
MFETLFGAEMPLALRFFIAFVVVLGLIGATAYVVRRFGGDRLGAATSRGRQPRLAVVDAASVDGRRRLILIRRDNVEHLLMIGGPTDVVVEPNIVRAAAAPREAAPARPPAAPEVLPRTVPLGEGNMWPLQPHPEPAVPPASMPVARSQRPTVPDEPAPWPMAE